MLLAASVDGVYWQLAPRVGDGTNGGSCDRAGCAAGAELVAVVLLVVADVVVGAADDVEVTPISEVVAVTITTAISPNSATAATVNPTSRATLCPLPSDCST